MKKLLAVLTMAALALSMLAACACADAEISAQQTAYDAFMDAADEQFAYGIALELSTNPAYMTSDMGGRNSGSDAEHAAAEYIAGVMTNIGLADVALEAAQCDLWSMDGVSLTVDGESYASYSYASGATPAEGLTAEVVYVGRGTMWDYEGLDVAGKIVLIDIDQRADWWITYPMLEAEHQGAAAIMAANVGGFAQIADDALNSQDICAPVSIPCVSIGLKDSLAIQEKLADGPVSATLVVNNRVEVDAGTTYNVTGRIKGESSDYQILVGAHYDMHFYGFQDDNCAVGLVLAMAKAMADSGYTPRNDIVFCLHGAEEWGSSGTQYDWTVGAWEMINNVHPDWVGRTLAFINFELPAYEFDTYTTTYSAPELYALLDYFANGYELSPEPENCFADGVLTEGYQTYTYSDDFSYYAAGVPTFINGFLLQKDMETVFPFYVDIYHSQYDTPDTYNAAVMDFNLRYYGALALYIDQLPALALDFTAQYERVLSAIDDDVMAAAGADAAALRAACEEYLAAAQDFGARVAAVNADYAAAQAAGDAAAAEAAWQSGRELTAQGLQAFAATQRCLLSLMYERPIVPHEAPQENITLCSQVIDCLRECDAATAADEYAWQINNVLEWYAMYFSPEVIDVQDAMFWGEVNQGNLYWGTGRTFVKADVEEATRSLMLRYDEQGGDFSAEIAVYEAAIEAQRQVLRDCVAAETQGILELAGMLK